MGNACQIGKAGSRAGPLKASGHGLHVSHLFSSSPRLFQGLLFPLLSLQDRES